MDETASYFLFNSRYIAKSHILIEDLSNFDYFNIVYEFLNLNLSYVC
jgi:hypothetical protein